MRSALALACCAAMLSGFPLSASQGSERDDPDSAATQAAASEALRRADVRPIKGEIRRIEGIKTMVSGQVLSHEAFARGLRASGLSTREVRGGVEVLLPGDVLFDFDQSSIRTGAFPVLKKLESAARQTGEREIRIDGHTDAVGTPAYNLRLSQARAQAVASWLLRSGISAARLKPRGFGATRPVAPNQTPTGKDDPNGRQRNRRVTVTFAFKGAV